MPLFKHSKNPKTKRKQGAVSKEALAKQKSDFKELLLMAVGALCFFAAGVFLYLSPLFNEKNAPPLNKPVPVVPIDTGDSALKEYEFYEILPKQTFKGVPDDLSDDAPLQLKSDELKVDAALQAPKLSEELSDDVPPNGAEQNDQNDATAKSAVTYVLQIETFDNPDDADARRDQVLIAGVDAHVLAVSDGEGGVWYQLVTDPLDKAAARVAAQRLASSGIDALVVAQK